MMQLYRKDLLEKMSSPEQLDKAVVIAPPSFWIAILFGAITVVVALIWSFFGTIPEKVAINGVYVPEQTSVAVSSETADIDGCMDFIKILLSSDIQNLSVEGFHSIPVNKQLVKTVGTNALKLHNEQVEQNLNMNSKEELLQLGLDITYLDESVIDYYISIIESCNTYASQDASIIVIATEEIQPYLEGQKSLSEVIDIMTNRVELLLEERKG